MNKVSQIPLSSVPTGQRVRLANIDAGQGLKSRLAAMGMVPNTEILVVSNGSPGPFVVAVKGCRIALGRGMARKVMVKTYLS
jgi:ferrous iron transport protein A